MHKRRWGAAALLTVTVAACSKPVPGPATLPPLTPSSSASTPPATDTGSPSPTVPPVVPSASTITTPASPTPSGNVPPTDNSVVAAVAAAKLAVGVLYRVSQTVDLAELKAVSYEHCNCRSTMATVVADLSSHHQRIVGKLPTAIRTRVVAHVDGVVRVQLQFIVPAHKTVSDAGAVSEELPDYPISYVFQMDYIGGRWLLYFVEDPT